MTYPFPGMKPPPPSPCGPACEPENHPGQAADLAVVTPWPYEAWLDAIHQAWAAGYPLETIVNLGQQGVHPTTAVDWCRTSFEWQAGELAVAARNLKDVIVAELSPVQWAVWKVLGWWQLILEGLEVLASEVRAWRARRRLRRELRRDR